MIMDQYHVDQFVASVENLTGKLEDGTYEKLDQYQVRQVMDALKAVAELVYRSVIQ